LETIRRYVIKFIPESSGIRKIVYFISDLLIVFLSLEFAFIIRFADDKPIPPHHLANADAYLPFFLVTASLIFYFLQFYRHLWQFASVDQYISILIGTTSQTVIVAVIMVARNARLPWSIYILYWLILSFLVAGYRILYRQYFRFKLQQKKRQSYDEKAKKEGKAAHTYQSDVKRVLVYGAGQAGFEVIRDLQENSRGKIPVVILDDNKAVHNHRILGIKVYGGRDKFQEAVETYQVDLIIIAIPSAPGKIVSQIIELAQTTGREIKVLPNLYDLYDSKATFAKTRDIEISDLLGRTEFDVDMNAIGAYLHQKTILVTGGGGSIGSELCRQIARFDPLKIIVFDIYENNAYQLANELKFGPWDQAGSDRPNRFRA